MKNWVLWKDKQDWSTIRQIIQEKRDYLNQLCQKLKGRYNIDTAETHTHTSFKNCWVQLYANKLETDEFLDM